MMHNRAALKESVIAQLKLSWFSSVLK